LWIAIGLSPAVLSHTSFDRPPLFRSAMSSPVAAVSCFQCRFGQYSAIGGLCIDRCPAGQVWSPLFLQCLICPAETHSLSGDVTCTRCPGGQFAPQMSATCYPTNYIGSKMKITGDIGSFNPDDFARQIANLLDSEPFDINIIAYRSGSVVVYFNILDPAITSLSPLQGTVNSANIRSLSGNEKTLLLYQWFVTNNPILEELTFSILDYEVYDEVPAHGGQPTEVVTLFEPGPAPPVVIPPQPVIVDGNLGVIPAEPAKTVFVPVNVGSASSLSLSGFVAFFQLFLLVALALWSM